MSNVNEKERNNDCLIKDREPLLEKIGEIIRDDILNLTGSVNGLFNEIADLGYIEIEGNRIIDVRPLRNTIHFKFAIVDILLAYTSYREYINKGYSQNDAVGKSLSELLGGILGGYAATKFLPHPLLKVFGAVIGVYLGSKAGGLLWDKMKNELSNIFNQMDNILNEYDDYYYDGKCNLKPKNPYLDQLLKDFYGMQDKILLRRAIYGDPLVVDLDGDGVETIGLDSSNAMFDLDGDGFREKTGWVSKKRVANQTVLLLN